MSEKKRVLVVDDEPDFADLVKQYLEQAGFEVEVAYDGVQGLEKVKANPVEPRSTAYPSGRRRFAIRRKIESCMPCP